MNILFLIIIACLLLIFLALNEYYKRVVIRNEQEAHIKRGRAKNNEYEIVAFGSSYARYAFDFSDTGLNGYNFGFVAQFFYYTDKMIRAFSSTFKEGCTVVITIPNLCFAEVGDGMYHPQRYVIFLNKKELGDEYSVKNYLLYNCFPLFIHPLGNIKKLIKYIIGVDKNDEYTRININPLSKQRVNVMALQRIIGWISSFGLMDTQSDIVPVELEQKFEKSRRMLSHMIQYCLDNGFKPVLVIPPVSGVMNSHLADAFVKKVLLDNIEISNNKKVPVFNYLRDSRFQDEKLYSCNADFLNVKGRKMFTAVFVGDLKKIGYVR